MTLKYVYSPLHNEKYVKKLKDMFKRWENEKIPIPVYVILTGGVERIILEDVEKNKFKTIFIIAIEENNSFPAALEIAARLRFDGKKIKIFMFPKEEEIFEIYLNTAKIIENLKNQKIGILDEPSSWLVYSSMINEEKIKEKLGLNLIKISWKEFEEILEKTEIDKNKIEKLKMISNTLLISESDLSIQTKFFHAFKKLHERYHLLGLTVKCFDMIKRYKNTPCVSFGLLNTENYITGCEGDIPALILMILGKLFNSHSWMANTNLAYDETLIISHCTAPLVNYKRITVLTHFESSLPSALKIEFDPSKKFTLAKMNVNFEIIHFKPKEVFNLNLPNLCRTQLKFKLGENEITRIKDGNFANHFVLFFDDLSKELSAFNWFLKK